jgi:MFS family permease
LCCSISDILQTFINGAAPKDKRSLWLSLFFCSIPIGYALGFIVAGTVVGMNPLGPDWTWRIVFLGEAALMIPFIILVLSVKGPRTIGEMDKLSDNHSTMAKASLADFTRAAKVLIRNNLYVNICIGYAAQTFILGGFA